MSTAATLTLTPSRYNLQQSNRSHHAPVSSSKSFDSNPGSTSIISNMISDLPHLDFPFSTLSQSMAAFTSKFDTFLSSAQQRVTSDREAFNSSMNDLVMSRQKAVSELTHTKDEIVRHGEVLDGEREEKEELERAVEALSLERKDVVNKREKLVEEIEGLKRELGKMREGREGRRRFISHQRGLDRKELKWWENVTGLRIEGVHGQVQNVKTEQVEEKKTDGQKNERKKGNNSKSPKKHAHKVEEIEQEQEGEKLKFVFTCVDEMDVNKEVSFVLDMTSPKGYAVADTIPVVDDIDVEPVIDRLNSGAELVTFLKEMREMLSDAVKTH